MGVMLSTLLITVPPMAGMWFNGVMGTSYGNNYFGGWNGGQPPPAGSGAGSGAHGSVGTVNQDKDRVSNGKSTGYLYGNRPLSTVALSSDHTDRFTSGERGAVTQ